ncbi:MAG: TIGR02530 family flagellar biosynthesis protein [Bacillota bacterium]
MVVNRTGGVPPAGPSPAAQGAVKNSGSFAELLARELKQQEVKLSAHASRRLSERNIVLSPADLQKIGSAAAEARLKGARESLILYKNMALVTSVANGVIVTAVVNDERQNQVFTNIDSAVLVK